MVPISPIPLHAAAVAVTERIREDAEGQELARLWDSIAERVGRAFALYMLRTDTPLFVHITEHFGNGDLEGAEREQFWRTAFRLVPPAIRADMREHWNAYCARRGIM